MMHTCNVELCERKAVYAKTINGIPRRCQQHATKKNNVYPWNVKSRKKHPRLCVITNCQRHSNYKLDKRFCTDHNYGMKCKFCLERAKYGVSHFSERGFCEIHKGNNTLRLYSGRKYLPSLSFIIDDIKIDPNLLKNIKKYESLQRERWKMRNKWVFKNGYPGKKS